MRPHTSPHPLLNSIVWVLGSHLLHYMRKGLPFALPFLQSPFRLVCPACLCVSLSRIQSPPPELVLHFPASLRASLIPWRLPGTGARWFKAIGSSTSQSTPPLPELPHIPPSLLPLFFHSPSFCLLTSDLSLLLIFSPPSFLLPLLPGSYAVIYIFVLSLSSCGDNLEFLWDVSFKIFK